MAEDKNKAAAKATAPMTEKPKPATRETYATDYIKSDIDAAVFTGNAHIDNLMTVVIALGAEVWAAQQRSRIMEALLESKGKVTKKMVEDYVPTDAEKAQWEQEREAMVKRVYAVLARDTSNAPPFAAERKF
jgi:hypothetical protein